MNKLIEQLIKEISGYAEAFIPNEQQYEKFQHALKKIQRKYIRKIKGDK